MIRSVVCGTAMVAASVAAFGGGGKLVTTPEPQQRVGGARPHVFVYKAASKFADKVPVVLADDRQHLASFPAPQDVAASGNRAKPIKLHHGYWLSEWGIAPNTVFLKYTFEEYAALKSQPSPDELLHRVTNKKPLKALYDCGPAGAKTTVDALNAVIDKGEEAKEWKPMR